MFQQFYFYSFNTEANFELPAEDHFLQNVIINEKWRQFAETIIVGDENFTDFIQNEFFAFTSKLDCYLTL